MSTDALHTQRQITCVSGRHGWANFCQIDETSVIYWQRPVWRATPSNKILRESVLFFWPVRMERSPCWHPWRNLHSYLQEKIENFLFLPGVWRYMTSFYVTIVMHLRSYSSGDTTKFLTWTWTWRAHLACGVSWCWVSEPTVSLWHLGPSCIPSQSAAHHGMTWTVPSAAGTHDSIYSSSELASQFLCSTHWTWAVDSNMSFTSSTEFVEIEQQ